MQIPIFFPTRQNISPAKSTSYPNFNHLGPPPLCLNSQAEGIIMHPDQHSGINRFTGPRTPAGKAVSAMNRLTHGCRSETTILRHEDHAEYTALIQGWLDQYNPQNPAERVLVDQTAHAQWFLMRNQRRFDEVDYEKNLNFRNWTDDQNHEYELALRYKTAAERAFLRWFKELESYYARVQRKQRLEAPKSPPPRTSVPVSEPNSAEPGAQEPGPPSTDPALILHPVFTPSPYHLEPHPDEPVLPALLPNPETLPPSPDVA